MERHYTLITNTSTLAHNILWVLHYFQLHIWTVPSGFKLLRFFIDIHTLMIYFKLRANFLDRNLYAMIYVHCHTSEKCHWQVTTANLTTASNYLQFPILIFNTDLRQVVQDYILPYIGYCLPIISVKWFMTVWQSALAMRNSIALVTFCDTLNQSDLNDSQSQCWKSRLDFLGLLHSWKENSAGEIQHSKDWERPQ